MADNSRSARERMREYMVFMSIHPMNPGSDENWSVLHPIVETHRTIPLEFDKTSQTMRKRGAKKSVVGGSISDASVTVCTIDLTE